MLTYSLRTAIAAQACALSLYTAAAFLGSVSAVVASAGWLALRASP